MVQTEVWVSIVREQYPDFDPTTFTHLITTKRKQLQEIRDEIDILCNLQTVPLGLGKAIRLGDPSYLVCSFDLLDSDITRLNEKPYANEMPLEVQRMYSYLTAAGIQPELNYELSEKRVDIVIPIKKREGK